MNWQKEKVTDKLFTISGAHTNRLKKSWFEGGHPEISYREFVPRAKEWFTGSKINDITGWTEFPNVDVTMGCTHYIESFILKYGWDGFQILKNEYAYYTLMGKHGIELDELEPRKPLIITMPHWTYCDIRPEWKDLLKICETKNIDIHIDMAWMIMARDINLDLAHPCIKSIGMSMSKFDLQWSRVGLRWSRQKTMDSVTIFNDYYKNTNTVMTSVGGYYMDNLSRDYAWETYGWAHRDICKQLDLVPTKIIHVVKDHDNNSLGIGNLLRESTPNGIN